MRINRPVVTSDALPSFFKKGGRVEYRPINTPKGWQWELWAISPDGHDDDGEYESTSNGASRLAEIELENTINVPVILRKNQGEEVAVMVARDLDFSSVYKLR